jgi:hypothetical protein
MPLFLCGCMRTVVAHHCFVSVREPVFSLAYVVVLGWSTCAGSVILFFGTVVAHHCFVSVREPFFSLAYVVVLGWSTCAGLVILFFHLSNSHSFI